MTQAAPAQCPGQFAGLSFWYAYGERFGKLAAARVRRRQLGARGWRALSYLGRRHARARRLVRTGAHYDVRLHRDDQGEWRPARRRSARLTHPDGGRGGGGSGGGEGGDSGGDGDGGGGGGGDGGGGGISVPEAWRLQAATPTGRSRWRCRRGGRRTTCCRRRQADGRVASEPFGPGTSRYFESYLRPEQEQDVLKWCRDDVRFQIYNCTSQQRVKGGEPRLKAPKAEFYRLDERGRRPHYKWTQLNDFDHAGEVMPPILEVLCEQLNTDFGLEGDDRFNHCLIICNEQSKRQERALRAAARRQDPEGLLRRPLARLPARVSPDRREERGGGRVAEARIGLARVHHRPRQRPPRAGEPARQGRVQGAGHALPAECRAGGRRPAARPAALARLPLDHRPPQGGQVRRALCRSRRGQGGARAARRRPVARVRAACCGGNGAAPAPEAATPATTRAGRKRKAGASSGGGEDVDGDIPRAAPTPRLRPPRPRCAARAALRAPTSQLWRRRPTRRRTPTRRRRPCRSPRRHPRRRRRRSGCRRRWRRATRRRPRWRSRRSRAWSRQGHASPQVPRI